jgi:hypothetical protein
MEPPGYIRAAWWLREVVRALRARYLVEEKSHHEEHSDVVIRFASGVINYRRVPGCL